MALPEFTMRQLLEAGVHFGHQTRRWNPKMAPYLFGVRNDTHIIDLQQSVPLLHRALEMIRDIVAGGGRVLFVGTKRQAADSISESAKRCGQFYVNHRWLGGMLTNWKTISLSIRRLRDLDERLVQEETGLTKKENLRLTRLRDKLERALGGIKDMAGLPGVLFVIDVNKESIAIAEASKLGIPVVAIIDSNCNPDEITYPIPGNDDAIRSVTLYCKLVSDAVLDGIQEELRASGGDLGEAETVSPKVPSESKGDPKGKDAAEEPAPAPEAQAAAPPADDAKSSAEAGGGDSETPVEAGGGEAETPAEAGGGKAEPPGPEDSESDATKA